LSAFFHAVDLLFGTEQAFLEHFDMLIDYAHRLVCLDNSAVMRTEVKGPHIALLTPAQTPDGSPLPKLLIITLQHVYPARRTQFA
jgi:hypothetical protein